MSGIERRLPEPDRLRFRARVLAEQGRALLLEAVALNVRAADLEDEQADIAEARRVAGVDVVLREEPA